jgi:hypothetical protein
VGGTQVAKVLGASPHVVALIVEGGPIVDNDIIYITSGMLAWRAVL